MQKVRHFYRISCYTFYSGNLSSCLIYYRNAYRLSGGGTFIVNLHAPSGRTLCHTIKIWWAHLEYLNLVPPVRRRDFQSKNNGIKSDNFIIRNIIQKIRPNA